MNGAETQTQQEELETKPDLKPGEIQFIGTSPAQEVPPGVHKIERRMLGTNAERNFPDVRNNYELDNALIGLTVKHNGCIIHAPWLNGPGIKEDGKGTIHQSFIKPIAAYLDYVKKESVPAGVHEAYSLTKRKGFTRQYTVSTSVKAGVSTSIFGCEASLEVTTGYSYTNTIDEETTESWSRSLTGPQDYWTFQPVLIYAIKAAHHAFERNSDWKKMKRLATSKGTYVFVPVHRNTPTVFDRDIGFISYADVIDYLGREAHDRW